MSEQNLGPEPAFANAAAASNATPALWNPTAAACWCLVLSPVFGAFLHSQNWIALGNPERAAASRKWVIWGSIFLVAVILSSAIVPESRSFAALGRFGGFALLISWYYTIGKSQQTYVEERFGKSYTRRGWTVPIISAIGIVVGIVFVLTLIALL